MGPTAIVAYLVLFATVAFLFIFASLMIGWLLRAYVPTAQKLEIYECGEPAVGSSFVQFDLRFYVVALVFIIFDVEVAFFFPWATVYGKAIQLLNPHAPAVVATGDPAGSAMLSHPAEQRLRELGVHRPQLPQSDANVQANQRSFDDSMNRLAKTALVDIGVFFAVLLVGFAYVWYRGDLDWVRATSPRPSAAAHQAETSSVAAEIR